ncbi:MAG: glutamate racemase [Actinomycetota bacterium]|nr:glutamate racemase [Actinomycetota bacterium]
MSDAAPIGVFDSGLGGLTVAHELMRQMPTEGLVYFGDTARVPYGPKAPSTVRRYSREIASFLEGEGVKAIVVACNTATAHALAALRAELRVPVVGVIEPGARAAVSATRTGNVGVIGTAGTIRSGAYERAIRELAPDARITAQPCPLFVPLVEEGWIETEATRLIASEYLGPLREAAVDTVVLGCTHYPLIRPILQRVFGRDVTLVFSAEETAREVAETLARKGIENAPDREGSYRFLTTGDPEAFRVTGARFLQLPIGEVEHVTLAALEATVAG